MCRGVGKGVLVNNAGVAVGGPVEFLPLEIFGIAFAVLAFWFLNSVDGDSGNDIANTPPSPVTTERIDVDEIVPLPTSR